MRARLDLARRLARLGVLPMLMRAAAVCASAATLTMLGMASAAAQPADYSRLPVDPNVLTDSLAWNAAPLDINPNGQQGVTAEYNHREGATRQITTTILFLPDPAAATNSLNGAAADVVNQQSQPAPVGTGGTIVTGTSPDGVQSVSVLTFTEGNAATTIEFDGPPNDPVPQDLVIDLGQKQATAITDWQAA